MKQPPRKLQKRGPVLQTCINHSKQAFSQHSEICSKRGGGSNFLGNDVIQDESPGKDYLLQHGGSSRPIARQAPVQAVLQSLRPRHGSFKSEAAASERLRRSRLPFGHAARWTTLGRDQFALNFPSASVCGIYDSQRCANLWFSCTFSGSLMVLNGREWLLCRSSEAELLSEMGIQHEEVSRGARKRA
ncbi:MAG: hypothetical protein ACI8TQ_002707 [Planctomycetota bacterium]|jgi:hypothetical protein